MALTPAEKQKAYRERQRALDGGENQAPEEVSPEAEVSVEQAIDAGEEAYVAQELEQTRLYIEGIAPSSPKATKEAIADRLARAENYARWRYRGWVAGEIASL